MGDLGNVLLARASLCDPALAAKEFDRLWQSGSPIVQKHMGAGTTYYNAGTKVVSFVAYNPTSHPVTIEAVRGGSAIGNFVAAPGQLTCVHKLDKLSPPDGAR